ncbi:MAG: hypothetical protein JO036_04220 [Candidatus Eremiobacteraeota bacterium]|nr:hypothetical protein [Candidatus Eremiobacteraeota bacterium]
MIQLVPNVLRRWFPTEVSGTIGVVLGSFATIAALQIFGPWSVWFKVIMAAMVIAAMIQFVNHFTEPFRREQRRVNDFVRKVPRPSASEVPRIEDQRLVIQQQFNGPINGPVTQNNYAAQTFPADELRRLLHGRPEAAAIDAIQHELASPKPQRSRVLSAIETLRGFTDIFEVSRTLNAWWSSPDVQMWIARLLTGS